MNKSNLIKGTIVLTIAGLLTRVIGFFYRIFLSNAMGAELLGIYQLIFPVYGTCFTIYASGLQTSISRMVAAHAGKGNYKNVSRILKVGVLISFSLALILSILVYLNAGELARNFLKEPRTESSLRILSYVFPFCGITACINGYYYGLRKTTVPATTQLLEQIVRVIFVYFIVVLLGKDDIEITCVLAAYGLVLGEVASSVYNMLSMFVSKSPKKLICSVRNCSEFTQNTKIISKELIELTLPLTANRLLLNILHSFEAILIPLLLRRYGMDSKESLSLFGILNGMVMPFLMFPSAITNALAVLLLPTISEAQALGNEKQIASSTSLSIKYSLIIGIFSTGIFLLFGGHLGTVVYHNETAGEFMRLLAMLCPFLYLTTTLSSVINGLGKAHITFFNSVIGMVLRIFLMVTLVPKQGSMGYIYSLIISQILITLLDGRVIAKETHFKFDSKNSLTKPFIIILMSGIVMQKVYEFLAETVSVTQTVLLLCCCMVLCVIFVGFMFVWKAMSRKEFMR